MLPAASTVPGVSLPLVINLQCDGGGWRGSATMPGRDVSGVPLRERQFARLVPVVSVGSADGRLYAIE